MDLVRNIAIAALLFLIFIVLTSGRSFGGTDEERGAQAKALAAAAPDDHTLKRLESEDARKAAEIERVKAAKARKAELERRCRIRPVMSDGEIASCRVAYRDLGEASK
jgi:multidrug resistance efflux pump